MFSFPPTTPTTPSTTHQYRRPSSRMPTPTRVSKLPLPSTATRSLLLLMLICDTPLPTVIEAHGTYHDIFTSLFQNSLAATATATATASTSDKSTTSSREYELVIESYDAVDMMLPDEERVREADGILITGSAQSAYLPLPWITSLVQFVSSLPSLNTAIKTIGICFGHQIIARAFGSSVCVNPGGWEVGVRRVRLKKLGREVFGGEELAIHQMHRDHVPTLPNGFELLGSTPICEIHGMVKFSPSAERTNEGIPLDLKDIQVITLQGHPEFSPSIVSKIIEVRAAAGAFSPEMAEVSRGHAKEHDEGIRIGGVLLGVLGL